MKISAVGAFAAVVAETVAAVGAAVGILVVKPVTVVVGDVAGSFDAVAGGALWDAVVVVVTFGFVAEQPGMTVAALLRGSDQPFWTD